MAQITPALKAQYGIMASRIPGDVLRQIPQTELVDRLVEARSLVAKAAHASDPVLRKGFGALADAVLTAQPRATVETQVAGLLKKAANSRPEQAAALRAEAERVDAANPAAPRRLAGRRDSLAKAELDGMVGVYTADGELVGVVNPDKITPIAPIKAPGAATKPAAAAEPAPDDGAQVAKGAIRYRYPRR